jgi:hypothetical protein
LPINIAVCDRSAASSSFKNEFIVYIILDYFIQI